VATSCLKTTALLLGLLFSLALNAAPEFPKLTGRVVDQAGLLSAAEESRLAEKLQAHEAETSNQIVIVTLSTLQGYDIADYGYQLGRHWGIGQESRDNGVLLLVAPNERRMRIEVGYGLEGALTDAISDYIIRQEMRPAFRAGDYPGGIEAGTDAILKVITGTYQALPSDGKKSSASTLFLTAFPVIFLFFFAVTEFIKKPIGGHFIPSLINAGFIGVVAWIVTGVVVIGIIAALVVLILNMFGSGGPGTGSGSGRSGGGWSSGSWGGGGLGGGGFSGGGGGFGGGGASGSW